MRRQMDNMTLGEIKRKTESELSPDRHMRHAVQFKGRMCLYS